MLEYYLVSTVFTIDLVRRIANKILCDFDNEKTMICLIKDLKSFERNMVH